MEPWRYNWYRFDSEQEGECGLKPYENILLISDLDGTLIPRGGVISEENKEALRRFVAGGGRFAIATGRTPEAAEGYVGDLPINAPSIFFNGSMLYDWAKREILATRPLLPAEDKTIWPRFAQEVQASFPHACIEVYTAENCHIISDEKYDDPRLPFEYYKYEHCSLDKLRDTEKTPWLKFFVCAEPAVLHRVERLEKKFGIDALSNSFYSEANYYEFVAAGVSKGTMVEEIRNLPEWKDYRIIAAGDYLNDNEMLKMADVGIASANAHPDTKAAAKHTGCAVEDHLMVWILDHIVGGKEA